MMKSSDRLVFLTAVHAHLQESMAAAADASVYRPVEIDSSQCDTLKAAKLLTPQVDCGTDGKWKADRSAPGDGVKRAGFVCNKHEACEVKLLIRQSGGAYSFLVKGSHTDVLSPGARKNSGLSWTEQEFARSSAKTGAKPAEIFAAMTDDALDAAKTKGVVLPKRAEGGLEGEAAHRAPEYNVERVNESYSVCICACIAYVFRACIPYVFCLQLYSLCILIYFTVYSVVYSSVFTSRDGNTVYLGV